MNRLSFIATLACLLFGTIGSPSSVAQETKTSLDPVKVMSFNIRYGSANDGNNHWRLRKELVVQTIKQFGPDLLGTQETLKFQAKFLKENLPDFSYVGRSRESESGGGEHCGIFFRTKRFTKLAEGHFWLSENPNQPGSKSWDSSLPRMATWVKLWDRPAKHAIVMVNTHFDHRGKVARAESARLINSQLIDLADELPAVLTGDFNTPESSEPYNALFVPPEGESFLVDTFRVRNPDQEEDLGTFNGFKGKLDGPRIDWIGATRSLTVKQAEIDHSNDKGRWPSDHCPATAVLGYQDK